MGRVAKAREAYYQKDEKLLHDTHSKDLITHKEPHKTLFTLPQIILGGQDGLVNVLGVILGVSAATSHSGTVIVAGLAAAFAESVSMGAVAYTSTLAKADYYTSEYERESWEIDKYPEGEKEEVREIYRQHGFEGDLLERVVQTITSRKDRWIKVMMEQELKLEPVDRKSAIPSAIIVGSSAIIGSFIPLVPFFILPLQSAVVMGMALSAFTLFLVGVYQARVTIGRRFMRSGMELMLIGMLSALVGYIIGSIFQV